MTIQSTEQQIQDLANAAARAVHDRMARIHLGMMPPRDAIVRWGNQSCRYDEAAKLSRREWLSIVAGGAEMVAERITAFRQARSLCADDRDYRALRERMGAPAWPEAEENEGVRAKAARFMERIDYRYPANIIIPHLVEKFLRQHQTLGRPLLHLLEGNPGPADAFASGRPVTIEAGTRRASWASISHIDDTQMLAINIAHVDAIHSVLEAMVCHDASKAPEQLPKRKPRAVPPIMPASAGEAVARHLTFCDAW